MIVGFPGETQADFEELLQFVETAQFDRLGVFAYSDEETSGSYHLEGKVESRTIENRKRRLLAAQRKISKRRNRELIGRELPVLIEGVSPETELLWHGRLSTQAPEIDGCCYINDFGPRVQPRPGEMAVLRVTEAHDYDLVGELVGEPELEPRTASTVNQSTVNPFPILTSHPAQTYSAR
jgi:ribosomal protein S12 methylthiotransferase